MPVHRSAQLLTICMTFLLFGACAATPAHGANCSSVGTVRHIAPEPHVDDDQAIDTSHRRVTASPARIIFDATPGKTFTATVRVTNSTQSTVRLSPRIIRLEAADDADALVQPSPRDIPSGYAYILPRSLPALSTGQSLTLPIRIAVDSCAEPGVSAVGLALRQTLAPLATNTDTGARITIGADLVVELIQQNPDDAVTRLSVRDVRGDRVVWGGGTPAFSAVIRNDGNVLLDLRGSVTLGAFANQAARTLHTDRALIMPGGKRRVTARWNDPPVVGWFRPTLHVEQDGATATATFRRVLILPPWWVLALIVVAVLVPIWHMRTRRNASDR